MYSLASKVLNCSCGCNSWWYCEKLQINTTHVVTIVACHLKKLCWCCRQNYGDKLFIKLTLLALATYQCVEGPEVFTTNSNSWSINNMRGPEFGAIANGSVIDDNRERNGGCKRVKNITNDTPNNKRVPIPRHDQDIIYSIFTSTCLVFS